jgi:amino acid adenylation domain-containing protein
MLNFPVDEGGIGGDGFTPDVPSKFELTVYAAETAGGLALNLVYNADLFDRERVAGMADQLETLLAQMAEDPEARLASLSLLTPAARAVLPDPVAELPFKWLGAIHERVARQAHETPGAMAAVDRSGAWTYRELDASASRLAQWLIQGGIRPGDVVAVHAHRSARLAAALLGVWKAGAAFVILDPAYPAARLASVLSLARPAAEIAARLELPETVPADDPGLPVDPNGTAYLAFTSGSTGLPKGIVGPHAPLSHFLDWHVRTFGLTPADRFSLLSGLSHDPLLRDLFTPLWLGATLCVPDPEEMARPGWLAGWMAREGVTVTHLTPAMGQLLAQDALPGSLPDLRLAFFVGDVLTGRDVARLRRVAPSVRCVNFYGATETPQAMGWYEVREGEGRIPLGRGIDGVQLLVLDRSGRLAGLGELGEIHIRTPYLAKGYLGDEEQTRERFRPDRGEVRLYRTGDLGRYRPDGAVEFAGRADTQVKIRGFRVEPQEIEAAVLRVPGVRECAVVLREDRLVAYVVPGPGTEVDASALRSHLAAHLPGYMVPAWIVPLPALPLTPNGKLDRRALPAPERTGGEASAPRTPVEERMAEIWRELLGVERVGVHDSFFDLGGHSLLATRLLSRLRTAFGAELPLRAAFEHPTIAGMARLLATGEAAAPPLVPLPRTGDLPLSFAQERLWFLYQFDPASPAYNIAQAVRLEGDLDEAALAAALREIVCRQESLRTRFLTRGRQALQVIDPVPDVVAPVADLASLPADLREGEAARIAREQALRPFDLEQGPVLRVRLLRLTGRERLLSVALHHIVTDGWSMGIFVREVATLYAALAEGRPSPLPELPLQYADFAVWQRRAFAGEALDEALLFWRRQLAGAPVLELPTDRPRPAVQGSQGAREVAEIPADLARRLGDLARRQGATLFMVLAAAFQALLSRLSGQTDLTLGTPVAGRTRTELEDLIGFFVNTLVLRGDLAGDPSFRDLLARTRETALAAFAHQQVPFERLVDELRPERSLSHTPLFQAMLVLQNAPATALESPGLAFRPVETATVTAKFDLTLTAVEPGPDGPLGMMLEYRTELFDAGTVRRMLAAFETLLAGAVADSELHTSELPLLSEAERAEIAAWSGPGASFPESACLHDLFAAQAARTPGAVAVTWEGAGLTYGDLNARANRLARRLRRLGVGPESRVALAAERSLEMIVGILGILKAGGAYVPLDPSYPEERLAYLREDSRALVLLTREHLNDPSLDMESGDDVASLAHPDNAAYVIYTSGSTGVPKGTVVTHRNVARLFAATDPWFGFGPGDVWTLFHSFAFDFSVWEIWGALLYGGRLVVVPYLVSRTPGAFLDLLEREEVTVLNQTPSAFRQLVQAEGERGSGSLALRLVIFGGEALDLAGLAPWLDRHGDERPLLVNMYGITETTVHVSWRPITRADLAEPWRSPVGVPIPDLSIHVLDPHGQPVPLGVPGEMHVGGAGLARGYLGRPDLTAERYVPNPFTGSGERLYRSGDLARWRPGEEIDYLGRIDHQVKVRGFRIELGEIEAALVQHPAVREAVVLLRGDPGEPRLVAWIGTAGGEAPDGSDLRAFLAGKLPDYMIPAAFVALPALPLTAHGKVDRRALSAPEDLAERAERASVPPRTGLERLLVDLWEESLGLKGIGIDDDFFELGGNSIRAAILINLLRERLGRPVPVSALFLAPTVARLAALLEASHPAAQDTGFSPLVPLAAGGPGLPFFCVHPAGGVVFRYADLARALSPDRPVYGLQSLGLGDSDPQESIEEMAATYLEEILAVQPEGPYLLGGWSLGGAVALEMARRLRETGREVGLLVMIDAAAPWSIERRPDPGQDDAGFVLERLAAELDPAAGEALRAEAGKLQGLSSEERLEGIVAAAKGAGLLAADLGTEPVRRLVRVYRTNETAFAKYRPAPWAGRTLLVRATEGVMRMEPSLGWDGLLTGELEIVTLEGTHQTILLEPGVQDLVRVLRERLAAIS